METIKMVHNIVVSDLTAKMVEKDELLQNLLLVGAVMQSMKPEDAFNILFAAFGTLCKQNDLSKGKILFEWSEKFDKFDEITKEGM